MGDDDDGHLLFSYNPSYYCEKLFRFLRCKHCRRFIQNEHIRTSVQCLEDFHSLLQTYTDFIYSCLRVYLKAVFRCQHEGFTICSLKVIEHFAFARFPAHNNILCHSKGRHKHKMLMHHSYTHADSLRRTELFNLTAVYIYISVCGLMYSVKDIHESTFACTVFPYQGKDFSFPDIEGHLIVGQHTRKLHGNFFKSYC